MATVMDNIVSEQVKTFTKEEAIKRCKSITKDDLAAKVLVDKYFLYDGKEYLESTPAQMFDRLSLAISKAETHDKQEFWQHQFREALDDFKFVPAGRVLYGLGHPFVNITLKNCYVIGIREDSIKGIFQTAYEMAETYKAGGGCGIDISPLRPKGSPVKNAARESSGAVSFMDLFSRVTGTIGQKARIGALMICIDVSHPDIEDFIKIKGGDNLDLVRYANVSVKITDEFMNAVVSDKNFDLRWGGKVYKTIKAKQLWDELIHYAWKRAEPGLLFWDAVCREVPAHHYPGFKTIATNPCGEAVLSDGDSCNLGSMNLGKYVLRQFDSPEFDYKSFEQDVRIGTRFLDNIISLEKCPMPFQQKANDDGRRLGLGVMGYADMFLKMNTKYDSDKAMALTDKVMNTFMNASYDESCDLAIEKGPFPVFDVDTHFKSKFINRLPENIQNKIRKTGIRNIAVHAIAPTGSLSCIAQCSSSIEPVFMMKHIRKTNLGTAKKVEEHVVLHSVAKEYQEQIGGELPEYFVSAHQINPESRIKLQAHINKFIDQSISNTVNCPNDITEDKIGQYYMEAWKSGCKGITVYREGSREGVLVAIDQKKESTVIQRHGAPKRPKKLEAKVHVVKPNGKTYTVFVGLLDGRPYEVFALDHELAGLPDNTTGFIVREKDDNGDSDNVYHFEKGALRVNMLNRYEDQDASLVTRLMSTALRHGVPLEFISDQIIKSKVPITSLAKALGRAVAYYINPEEAKASFKCPECGSSDLKISGTCHTCNQCGWSKCS